MAVQFQKPVDDELDWQQRLVNYAKDRNSGKNEYQRAMDVFRAKSAIGDTEGAGAAQKWAGQVRTAVGEDAFKPANDINEQLKQYAQRINRPATPFAYDPQSDAQYQNALSAAQRGAQTASNNAMVSLGRRGIGNSQSAVTAANSIQQRAIADVNSNVLPQLIAQAYQRYRDQQNQDNTQNQAFLQMLQMQNGLNQQEFQNDRALAAEQRTNKLDNQQIAQWYTQMYGKQFDPKQDWGLLAQEAQGLTTLPMQQFNLQKQGQEFNQGMATRQQDFSEGQNMWERDFRQNEAARAAQQFAASQGLQWAQMNQRERETMMRMAMEMDPNSLDNQYKKAQIDSLKAKTDTPDAKFEANRDAMVQQLRAGKLGPEEALKAIDEDQRIGYYTPDQAESLRNVVSVLYPQQQGSNGSGYLDYLKQLGGQAMPNGDYLNWVKSLINR